MCLHVGCKVMNRQIMYMVGNIRVTVNRFEFVCHLVRKILIFRECLRRENIWLDKHKLESVTMQPCFQPEIDGYVVSSLSIGTYSYRYINFTHHLCCRSQNNTVSSY